MIEQIKQYKLSLSIIAILAVIKFALLPLLTWQGNMVTDIDHVAKRLNKAQQVFNQRDDIEQAHKQIVALKSQFEALLYSWQDPSKFRIEAQKQVNKWLNDFELQTNNIGWQPEFKFLQASIHREQMRANIKGDVAALGRFLMHLEAQHPMIAIEYFDMRLNGISAEQGGSGEASLLISFYLNERQASNE